MSQEFVLLMLSKKTHLISKTFEIFLSMHSIVFGIQWDFFPVNRHIFPTASLSLLQHIYCSCTWMNVLQRADTTYGLYCVCRHISQCGPLYVGTAPTLFPHCSLLPRHSIERLGGVAATCCCASVLLLLLKWWKDLRWWSRGVWNDLLGSWRKKRHGSLCSSVLVEVLFLHRSRNIVQRWEVFIWTTWTHWITLYTPFGNGAFTPIDTLLLAATTKTKSTCG